MTSAVLQLFCAVFLYEINNFAYVSKGHTNHGIGSAIIYSYFVAVVQGCTREYHVGHIACKFLRSSWGK